MAEAYAPLAGRLAQAGSLAVVALMPLRLAIFDSDAATAIMDSALPAHKLQVGVGVDRNQSGSGLGGFSG